MYQYTDQNHFEFGYRHGRKYCNRQEANEIFYADVGSVKKNFLNWRAANIDAVFRITQNLPGPYWILLSGGTDSEICLRAFLEANVPVNVATLRLANGANAYDIEHVYKLQKQLDVKVHFFDLDAEAFLKSKEFYQICNVTANISPIYAFHLWLASQLDGTPIMAQGEVHLKKGEDQKWYYVESERLCALYRYFIFYDKPAVPGFFQYTPEQIFTYLKFNPFLKKLINNEVEGKLGTRSSKNLMAQQFYPEVEMRTKYTGFEKIEDTIDIYRKQLRAQFAAHDQFWYCEVNDFISRLQG